MYKYDEYDHAMVEARVAEFSDQVRRRLAGEITEDQFKPLRLMNGLYLQLHAYMLRVAVPYGTLDSRQMRMLAHIARKYDRDYGHFTTRQNIQYNWIKLEECADLLAELASVEMHAIQTSGNCIRNISSDQYAGAAADEVADPLGRALEHDARDGEREEGEVGEHDEPRRDQEVLARHGGRARLEPQVAHHHVDLGR